MSALPLDFCRYMKLFIDVKFSRFARPVCFSIASHPRLEKVPSKVFCISCRYADCFSPCCRLWAEVFHVSSGTGTIKWQQVSEDLVPVNITCIQDSPECVFHITAYNSQVDKILDVRLVQPGMKFSTTTKF